MNEQERLDISILYVEDEPAAREEILIFLQRRAREVFAAANGREGLDLYREKRPDLVITDIRMPFLDGLAMAKAIRAIDRDAKIVVTSAHGETAYLMQAIDIGIDVYVMKPVGGEKLIAAIRKCAEVVEHRKEALRHQHEMQRSMEELRAALLQVKQLSGLLPICASCKKIRDDKGYWQQIETYIRAHSEAEFTHGICPDCTEKFFPGVTPRQPAG
ncbi:MAG: response regulator transcription factor [Candidatus Methylomirabilia bacterium]